METQNSNNFKVVILGEFKVGKTSIINKKVHGDMGTPEATVGFGHVVMTVRALNQEVTLDIFDTAGQEKYNAMTGSVMRNAHIFIFTYSVEKKEDDIEHNYGFDKLDTFYDLAKSNTNIELAFVVQNKIDYIKQEDYLGAGEKGHEWCKNHSAYFYQTSAKSGQNIDELFTDIAVKAIQLQNVMMQANNIKIEEAKNDNNCSC